MITQKSWGSRIRARIARLFGNVRQPVPDVTDGLDLDALGVAVHQQILAGGDAEVGSLIEDPLGHTNRLAQRAIKAGQHKGVDFKPRHPAQSAETSIQRVRVAFSELDPVEQEVLLLSTYEGMTSAEIAQSRCESTDAIRGQLTTAFTHLRFATSCDRADA